MKGPLLLPTAPPICEQRIGTRYQTLPSTPVRPVLTTERWFCDPCAVLISLFPFSPPSFLAYAAISLRLAGISISPSGTPGHRIVHFLVSSCPFFFRSWVSSLRTGGGSGPAAEGESYLMRQWGIKYTSQRRVKSAFFLSLSLLSSLFLLFPFLSSSFLIFNQLLSIILVLRVFSPVALLPLASQLRVQPNFPPLIKSRLNQKSKRGL